MVSTPYTRMAKDQLLGGLNVYQTPSKQRPEDTIYRAHTTYNTAGEHVRLYPHPSPPTSVSTHICLHPRLSPFSLKLTHTSRLTRPRKPLGNMVVVSSAH